MPAKIKFTNEQLEEIKHLYGDELGGPKAIDEKFNCSDSTIRLRLKDLGVELGDKKLIGKRFGLLTVIEKTEEANGTPGGCLGKCQCDCGKVHYVRTSQLTRKKNGTKSCGCTRDMHIQQQGIQNGSNLIGKRFGQLMVLEKTDKRMGRVIIGKCKCDCGNITYVATTNLNTGHTTSCGCIKSQGELIIRQLLEQANINFIQEYRFDDCRYKKPLPFDFYLPDYNICIEYDGAQHHYNTGFGDYGAIRRNDNIKTQYCLDNNIKLIRIPCGDRKKLSGDYLKKKLGEEVFKNGNYSN